MYVCLIHFSYLRIHINNSKILNNSKKWSQRRKKIVYVNIVIFCVKIIDNTIASYVLILQQSLTTKLSTEKEQKKKEIIRIWFVCCCIYQNCGVQCTLNVILIDKMTVIIFPHINFIVFVCLKEKK